MMNMAAFAVVVARERETGQRDSIASLAGLGRGRPLLARPMTLAVLGLARIPATAGLVGKIYLIEAAVESGYAWLGVGVGVGSMISLGYYLPVIATMWMRDAPTARVTLASGGEGSLPALAGGSSELDEEHEAVVRGRQPEVVLVAVVAGAATLFFGIVPQPLFELVRHTGSG